MTVKIEKLTDTKISDDGKQVKFIAHGTKGEQLESIFPIDELEAVTQSFIGLLTSSTITSAGAQAGKRNLGEKAENGWHHAPPVLLVKDFQTADNPDTGALLLRLLGLDGNVIDVSFQPEHVPALKKMLHDVGTPPPPPQSERH